VVLEILRLLETTPPQALDLREPDRLAILARALQRGHLSRRESPAVRRPDPEGAGETTHFSIVDADGLAVSGTASINNYFGARAASVELGFLYNDYMKEFVLGDPSHPFALRPGAFPYSSMSPTILMREGRPELILGSPGSERILSAVAQVIALWVDGELPIAEAVSAPRIHTTLDGAVLFESEHEERKAGDLGRYGLRIEKPPASLVGPGGNPYFGGVHAIAFEAGRWQGSADPRRDGAVVSAGRR
jgi:gamma-glutamyltranspeptidase/glutathione hydrolase